jgi:hypothetical protein
MYDSLLVPVVRVHPTHGRSSDEVVSSGIEVDTDSGKAGIKLLRRAAAVVDPHRRMGERMLRQMERSTVHVMAKRGQSIRQIAAVLGAVRRRLSAC